MTVQRAAGHTFERILVVSGGVLFSLLLGARADAAILNLTPAGTTCTSNLNTNLDDAGVLGVIDDCFGAVGPLSLLYKADQGDDTDEGTFGNSYDTIFSNTSTDPQDATILYLGGTYMDCSACYVVVKDGNQTPAQYFYNISSWNGTDTIQLTGFWPQQGAISNVAIWGRATSVPEPGSMLLFAAGLGLVSLRRRRDSRIA